MRGYELAGRVFDALHTVRWTTSVADLESASGIRFSGASTARSPTRS